jgi:hypothetical protein
MGFGVDGQKEFLDHLLGFCCVPQKFQCLPGYPVDVASENQLKSFVIASPEPLHENLVILFRIGRFRLLQLSPC